ncbi:MAG: hypothetical protein AAB544_05800 [Patescibacteria group bacterium]
MQKKHEICLVRGCGKPTSGRQHCAAHGTPEQRRKLSTAIQKTIRSACCSEECFSGEGHENGEQYCAKCKEPCGWKSVSL